MKNSLFKRQFINSAIIDNNVGKIELYGDVYEEEPRDWWTGEPLLDNCITVNKFKEALAQVKNCSSIELHLNSYGGDATVGLLIHNLLRAENKKITCVIDGIAASAAFTIAMGCDEVQVYPGSILMCHEVKSLLIGYYGNRELQEQINGNTAYNKSAAAMYAQKSGMTEQQCLNLMSKTTWLTGQQAIDLGFANTMLDNNDKENAPNIELVNKTTLKVNGVEHNIQGLNVPDELLHSITERQQIGGREDMAKENVLNKFFNAMQDFFKNEVEEEKAEKEEQEKTDAEQEQEQEGEKQKEEEKAEKEEQEKTDIANSAMLSERARIQEIEKIQNSIDSDLVQEAKFGATACDAKELAMRAMQREEETKSKALTAMQNDNESSKVNNVSSIPSPLEKEEEGLSQTAILNAVEEMYNKIKSKEVQ